MISCVRRIQFCAGHRVVNHESKCRNLHGHNYVAFLHARAVERSATDPGLDAIGRVIDFSVLKEKVGGWIEREWDHGLVLWAEDPIKPLLSHAFGQLGEPFPKWYSLRWNPTAENMAEYLLRGVCPVQLRGTGVEVHRVVLWETENCFAEAEL